MGNPASRPSFGNNMMDCGCLWVADEHRVGCFHCETPFSFQNRRHHCRLCGELFCDIKKATVNRDGTTGAKKATCWGNKTILTSNLFPPEVAQAVEAELAKIYAAKAGRNNKSNNKAGGATAAKKKASASGAGGGDGFAGLNDDLMYSGSGRASGMDDERASMAETNGGGNGGAALRGFSNGGDGSSNAIVSKKKGAPAWSSEAAALARLLSSAQPVCAVCYQIMRTPLLRPLALNVRSLLSDADPHNVFVVRVVLHGVTHKRSNGKHDHFVSLEALAAAERSNGDLESLVVTMMSDAKNSNKNTNKKSLKDQLVKQLEDNNNGNASSSRMAGASGPLVGSLAPSGGGGGGDSSDQHQHPPALKEMAASMTYMAKLLRINEGENSEAKTENGNLVGAGIPAKRPSAIDAFEPIAATPPVGTPTTAMLMGSSGFFGGAGGQILSSTSENDNLLAQDPASPLITDAERTTFFANGLLLLGAAHPSPFAGAAAGAALQSTRSGLNTSFDKYPNNNASSNNNKSYSMKVESTIDYNDLSKHIMGGGGGNGGGGRSGESPQSAHGGGDVMGATAPFPQRVFGGSGYYEISLEQWRPFNKQTRLVFRTPDAAEVSDRPHTFGTLGAETHHTVKLRKVFASPKAAAIATKISEFEGKWAAESASRHKSVRVDPLSGLTSDNGGGAPSSVSIAAAGHGGGEHRTKFKEPPPPIRSPTADDDDDDDEDAKDGDDDDVQKELLAKNTAANGVHQHPASPIKMRRTDSGRSTPTPLPLSLLGTSPGNSLHSKGRLSSPTSAQEKDDVKSALHAVTLAADAAADGGEDEDGTANAATKQEDTNTTEDGSNKKRSVSPSKTSKRNFAAGDAANGGEEMRPTPPRSPPPAPKPSAASTTPPTAPATAPPSATNSMATASTTASHSAPRTSRTNSMMGRNAPSEWDAFLPAAVASSGSGAQGGGKKSNEPEVDYDPNTKVELVTRKVIPRNVSYGCGDEASSASAGGSGARHTNSSLSQGNFLKGDRGLMKDFAEQVAKLDAAQQKQWANTPRDGGGAAGGSSTGVTPRTAAAVVVEVPAVAATTTAPVANNNNASSTRGGGGSYLDRPFTNNNSISLNGSGGGAHYKRAGSTLRLAPSPVIFTAFNPQARSGIVTPAQATGMAGDDNSVFGGYTVTNFAQSQGNLTATGGGGGGNVTKGRFNAAKDGTVSVANFNSEYDSNNEAKVSALKKRTRRGKRQMDLTLNIDDKQLEVTMPASWSLGCSSVVGVDVIEGEALGSAHYTKEVGEREGELLVEKQEQVLIAIREKEERNAAAAAAASSSLPLGTSPSTAGGGGLRFSASPTPGGNADVSNKLRGLSIGAASPKTSMRNPSTIKNYGAGAQSITQTNPIAQAFMAQPVIVPCGVSGKKYLRIETFQEIFYFSIGNNQYEDSFNKASASSAANKNSNANAAAASSPTPVDGSSASAVSASAAPSPMPLNRVVSAIRHPCIGTAIETNATPMTPGYASQRAVLDKISSEHELCIAVKRAVDIANVRGRVRVSSVKILKAGEEEGPKVPMGYVGRGSPY